MHGPEVDFKAVHAVGHIFAQFAFNRRFFGMNPFDVFLAISRIAERFTAMRANLVIIVLDVIMNDFQVSFKVAQSWEYFAAYFTWDIGVFFAVMLLKVFLSLRFITAFGTIAQNASFNLLNKLWFFILFFFLYYSGLRLIKPASLNLYKV